MKTTRKTMMTLVLALVALCFTAFGIGAISASASALVGDPSFNFIAGGSDDMAYFNEDGTVSLDVTPTPGFGFRANATNLGEANLIDVKNFTTTIELTNVPINVSTVFSLQTVPTGTLTAGNGLNFMFRRDSDSLVAVAIYDSNGSEPAYWAPGQLQLPADKTITFSINYDAVNVVTLTLADTYALPTSLISTDIIDSFYKDNGYKGYYSISSYYFVAPASTDITYTVKSINGATPLENYRSIVNKAVSAYENAVNGLTETSTNEEIEAVAEYKVFDSSTYATLISVIDTDGSIATKIAEIDENYNKKYQKVQSAKVDAQITAFANVIDTLDLSDAQAVDSAIEAYEAIDKTTLNSLTGEDYTTLTEKLSSLITGEKFKTIIKQKTEAYVAEYETKVASGDAASLSTYKDINAIVEDWDNYKELNYLTLSLTAEEIAVYDARIDAIEEKMSTSFYANFWTEGNTWDARKTDNGLYATGEGKYYETLGFNQKLELGKTTTIEFNVIYALRKLGANHLHIGFYPEVGTGTKGNVDGVRADFWFSEVGVVEIPPVNGKTEEKIYEGAYLSIEDTGLLDVDAEEIDYTQGKYTVTLSEEDGVLVLTVNGLSMDITGLSPEIYANGVYITVSTMSVPGAAYNEVLITKVGDTSFVKGEENNSNGNNNDETESNPSSDGENNGNSSSGGCLSSVGVGGMFGLLALGAITILRKKNN